MSPILATSILGGILAVDHRSSVRTMISQPLVGGLLTGMVLGATMEGFLAGALFQMLFLGNITLRGEHAPDLPVGGVAAAALYILVSRDAGNAMPANGNILMLSMLLAILVAGLGRYFYMIWEKWAGRLADRAFEYARNGRLRRASAIHLSMIFVHFLYGFTVLLAVLPPARSLIAFGSGGSAFIDAGPPGMLVLMVPFIGIGSLARLHLVRSQAFWFAAGFLFTVILMMIRG